MDPKPCILETLNPTPCILNIFTSRMAMARAMEKSSSWTARIPTRALPSRTLG